MLKFLGIEEKSCDPLTGSFCSEEQQLGSTESSQTLKAHRAKVNSSFHVLFHYPYTIPM